MEISILLTKQILAMALMGVCGYIIRKIGMISKEGSRGLTSFCVYISAPAALFLSFQTHFDAEKMAGFIYSFIAVTFVHVLYFLAIWGIRKFYEMDGIEYTSAMYSNCVNMIIPLVIGIFGSEYVFYTSAYQFYGGVLLWSHALVSIRGGKLDVKKMVTNPCIIAVFAGLLYTATGLGIPSVVHKTLSGLGDCLGPIAMVTIGIMMADVDMKAILSNNRIYIVTALRLIIFPIICIIGCTAVRMVYPLEFNPVVYLIIMLAACAPAPITIAQIAQIYDKDYGYASSINVFTTLLSILTMPVMIWVAQLVM